jgi:alanine dehydrogenase
VDLVLRRFQSICRLSGGEDKRSQVVVLGAGSVGWNAARIAAAMDAEVFLLDRSPERLRSLEAHRRGRLVSLVSSSSLIERLVPSADLLIGAGLVDVAIKTLVLEPALARVEHNRIL